MSDDFSADEEFAETHSVWWAGIVFASIVTFAIIGGLLITGTYLLNNSAFIDLSYWVPTVVAAVLTVMLVTVALKRGEIKYEPR